MTALRETESHDEVDVELLSLLEAGEFPELARTVAHCRVDPYPRRLERTLKLVIASALG